MIFSLTPLYITQVFGLAAFQLGILEGCVEFCSWITRIFSGIISDYMRKRKPVLLLAYGVTLLSRPFFALAPGIGWIYSGKLLDRISNGIQATPREALVGDLAPKEIKGSCYGLRQSLGLIGSLIGASGVVYLMHSTNNNYQFIFWIAGIPPLLAFFTIVFFVKDSAPSQAPRPPSFSFGQQIKKISHLGKPFWGVCFVSGIFMISNYSGAYRILQAEQMGFPLADISMTMAIQNLAALLSAFPIGRLSDTFDRRILLGIGFSITILANLFLGFYGGIAGISIGSALWGMQMGITQSIFLSLVSSTAPKDLRGSAFGAYYLVTAVALFAANLMMGWFFGHYGSTFAFSASALVAALALPLLPIIKPAPKPVAAPE